MLKDNNFTLHMMAYASDFYLQYFYDTACFPKFSAVRTRILKYDVFTNDSYHGLFPDGVYLSEIMTKTLTFCDHRTVDATYCADVMLFLHATSSRLPLTAAFFLSQFHVLLL